MIKGVEVPPLLFPLFSFRPIKGVYYIIQETDGIIYQGSKSLVFAQLNGILAEKFRKPLVDTG